jgi:hypothetical protein
MILRVFFFFLNNIHPIKLYTDLTTIQSKT